MQTGRYYRAARPRGSTPWLDWNQRAPERLFLQGEFVYVSNFLLVPPLTMSIPSHYTFADANFAWGGTFSVGLYDFGFEVRQIPHIGSEGFDLRITLVDAFGSVLMVTYHLLDSPFAGYGSIFYPTSPPDSIVGSGFFDGGADLVVRAVFYHQEP